MLIVPPHMHMHFESLVRMGRNPPITFDDPGIQGAGTLGMHGMGVSTPAAAAVADATVGFAGDLHIPNGLMFTMGL